MTKWNQWANDPWEAYDPTSDTPVPASRRPDITPDGYRIIPPLPPPVPTIRGVQCGQCGMKFDNDKAYGYCCPYSRCPIWPKVTSLA